MKSSVPSFAIEKYEANSFSVAQKNSCKSVVEMHSFLWRFIWAEVMHNQFHLLQFVAFASCLFYVGFWKELSFFSVVLFLLSGRCNLMSSFSFCNSRVSKSCSFSLSYVFWHPNCPQTSLHQIVDIFSVPQLDRKLQRWQMEVN